MRKFKEIIKENMGAIIVVSILTLLRAFSALVIPISFSYLSENGINMTSLIVAVLLTGLNLIMNILIVKAEKKNILAFKTKLQLELFGHLFKMNYGSLNKNGATYYINKIDTAVNHYSDLILKTLPMFVNIWIVVLVSIWVIGRVSIWMLIILGVMLLVQNLGFRRLNKELSQRCVKMQDITARGYSNIYSVCENIDYIKQKDEHTGILRLLRRDVYDIHKINAEVNAFAGNVSAILGAIVTNIQYFMYILMGFFMAAGRIKTSDFVVVVMMVDICFSYVSQLVRINLNMKDVNASYDFIEKELKTAAEEDQGREIERIDRISFRDTSVGYDGMALLEKVNLQISRGDVVFISAETGTGKSSLAKLLVGFYHSQGIFMNDIPMEELSIGSVRKKIFYMSQQPSIICGSLADNIFMGEERDRQEIDEKLAGLGFFDKFMDHGIIKDMDIQPDGANLSGGDKQKIMVSRIFVENPDVLILDEVTSSMDTETSDRVYEEIVNKFADRIILIISHNENAKEYANRHIRIEKHRLIEE